MLDVRDLPLTVLHSQAGQRPGITRTSQGGMPWDVRRVARNLGVGAPGPLVAFPRILHPPPANPEDADHHQGIASGDADVPVDVVPMNAGLA